MLLGQKIWLRPLEPEDAPTIASFINHPSVRETIQQFQPLSIQSEKDFIHHINNSTTDRVYGIVEKSESSLIGVIGLHKIDFRNGNAVLGLMIGIPALWNKGFATDALSTMLQHSFETLRMHRIELEVFPDNPHAIHMYQKCGFTQEGIRREVDFRRGTYRNSLVMSLLDHEYFK